MKLINLIKDIKNHSITFEWEDYPEDTESFNIYQGQSQTNKELIGRTPLPLYTDNIYWDTKQQDVYYYIEAIDQYGKPVAELHIPLASKRKTPYSRVYNISKYKTKIVLSNPNFAFQGYLLQRKRSGELCSCYSEELNASAKPGCRICYGTGRVGGYNRPIPIKYLPLQEQVKDVDIIEEKPTALVSLAIVTSSFPTIHPGDIIYTEGLYYEVESGTSLSIMSQKMATQQLRLNTLSTSNSIYEYPLENTITKLNYAFWKDGKLYIRGENLTPYYGTVKITPFTQANTQYHHLHGQDILSATDAV